MILDCIRILIVLIVMLTMCCCTPKVQYVPVCPYGVGWITANDYQILSDPDKISDMFADWVLATNMYCEGAKNEI